MVCGDSGLGKSNFIEYLLLSLNREKAEELLKGFNKVNQYAFGQLSGATEAITTFPIQT
jgi:septin family protein